jgi:hypothetical protein
MANVKYEQKPQAQHGQQAHQAQQAQAKQKSPVQLMRERLAKKVFVRPGIRVSLAPHRDNPTMRRLLRHPKGGGFGTRDTVEWPDDVFTFRRLRDGDIVKAAAAQAKTKPSTSTKSESAS